MDKGYTINTKIEGNGTNDLDTSSNGEYRPIGIGMTSADITSASRI